jgi:hypothetical protein
MSAPRLEAYGRTALDSACSTITGATRGAQEKTLHRECFAIGGLVAGNVIKESEARARLIAAAREMPAYGEKWAAIERKVELSFQRGMQAPRKVPDSRDARGGSTPTPQPARPPGTTHPTPTGTTTTAQAIALWNVGLDPRGTPGQIYLERDRKLELGGDLAGEVLRWHPDAGAILALFRNIASGEPQAVTRILLDQNARKIGRRFFGPVAGAAIMLDAWDEVTAGLHICEGVETGMAARQFDLKPTWALGSAGAISSFPVLGGVECLTLLQENDDASARACEACAARWHAAGREVILITPKAGKDINDIIINRPAPP